MKIFVLLLLVIHFCVIISASLEKNATYDEAVNITSGYIYLKTGNFSINKEHLTFWKMFTSLPLLLLKLTIPDNLKVYQYELADKFIYENKISADTILLFGRILNALGAIVLGFIIFKWSSELWGKNAAFLSLILYLLCPNITGYAGYVNTDFGLTVLMFLSVYFFWIYSKSPSPRNIIIAGILFGLTQATKVSAFLLYPTFLILGIIYWYYNKNEKKLKEIIVDVLKIFIIGFIVLSMTYLFYGLPNYFSGIKQILNLMKSGSHIFVSGKIYSHGPWYYCLFAFLIKNTIPFLVLFLGALIHLFILRKNLAVRFKQIFLLILPFILLVVASLNKRQLGMRYILPVYPFLFVSIGLILKNFDIKKISIVIPLILWMSINNVKVYPHYLTFFNELVGGPKNGYKCLVYDLDAGQDLKELKKFLQPDDELILSYFGSARPEYYGIDCQYAGVVSDIQLHPKVEKINSLNPKRELLAVSASFLQMARLGNRKIYSWLKQYKPINIIGNTILIYDITADVNAHKNLGYTYMELGASDNAIRQWQRVLVLKPNDVEVHFCLACIYNFQSLYEKAIKECNLGLSKDRGSYMIHNLLGQIYMKQGKIKKANDCFEKAIEIKPDFVEAHSNLAIVRKKQK